MKKFSINKANLLIKMKKNANNYTKSISLYISVIILIISIILFTFAFFTIKSPEWIIINGKVKYNPFFELKDTSESIVSEYDEYSNTNEIIDEGIGISDSCTHTLVYDGTSSNNLRLEGKNPCNYVSFNGELWRIVGFMNDIYTSEEDYNNKTNENSLIKLVKAESLGNYSWDSSDVSVNSGRGINQWGESKYSNGSTYEGADLMRELNNDYFNNIVVGTNGKWFSAEKNTKDSDIPNIKLNSQSEQAIEKIIWNTGSNGSNTSNTWTTTNLYSYERSNNSGKLCSSGNGCNDTVNRNNIWYGKVALIYPSDFGFATSGGNSVNRNSCLSTSIYNWKNSELLDCSENNWLDGINSTLFPVYELNNRADIILSCKIPGNCYFESTKQAIAVYPALYLKGNVKIEDGDGSIANSYIISLNGNILSNRINVGYTINYNLNGGSVKSNPKFYTGNNEIRLNKPTKKNYGFTGWTGSGLSGLTQDVIIPVGSTGNREYTANFAGPLSYTINGTCVTNNYNKTICFEQNYFSENGNNGKTVLNNMISYVENTFGYSVSSSSYTDNEATIYFNTIDEGDSVACKVFKDQNNWCILVD